MFKQARKLKELQRSRRSGAIPPVDYAEKRARATTRPRRANYFVPRSGFVLTGESVENGRIFVRTTVRILVIVAVALTVSLMLPR